MFTVLSNTKSALIDIRSTLDYDSNWDILLFNEVFFTLFKHTYLRLSASWTPSPILLHTMCDSGLFSNNALWSPCCQGCITKDSGRKLFTAEKWKIWSSRRQSDRAKTTKSLIYRFFVLSERCLVYSLTCRILGVLYSLKSYGLPWQK